MSAFARFNRDVMRAGLSARDCGNGHWQITGGAFLVNYYPSTRKIYVAATTKSSCGNIDKAIRAAQNGPLVAFVRDRRSRYGYGAPKRRMLRRDPHCHWCRCDLTAETATLDHVIPLAKGGLDNANNWVLACRKCNKERGNKLGPPKRAQAGVS